MEIFLLVGGIVDKLLALGLIKFAHPFIKQKMELDRAFYEEDNKPSNLRNNARLDQLRFELCNLALAVTAEIGKPSS